MLMSKNVNNDVSKDSPIEACTATGFEPVTLRYRCDALTGIARSRVQTPLKSCLNCVHNCDDHSSLDMS